MAVASDEHASRMRVDFLLSDVSGEQLQVEDEEIVLSPAWRTAPPTTDSSSLAARPMIFIDSSSDAGPPLDSPSAPVVATPALNDTNERVPSNGNSKRKAPAAKPLPPQPQKKKPKEEGEEALPPAVAAISRKNPPQISAASADSDSSDAYRQEEEEEDEGDDGDFGQESDEEFGGGIRKHKVSVCVHVRACVCVCVRVCDYYIAAALGHWLRLKG